MTFQLTGNEIKACAINPEILMILSFHHAVCETQADASDMPVSAEYHKKRRIEIQAEINRLQTEIEKG